MYFPIIDVLKENFIAKIPSIVTQWLTDNVVPVGSAVVVDESLSISGAAADAKVTGDEISNLKSDLNEITIPNIDIETKDVADFGEPLSNTSAYTSGVKGGYDTNAGTTSYIWDITTPTTFYFKYVGVGVYASCVIVENPTREWQSGSGFIAYVEGDSAVRYRTSDNNLPTENNPYTTSNAIVIFTKTTGYTVNVTTSEVNGIMVDLLQTTGASTKKAMSQKAVTDALKRLYISYVPVDTDVGSRGKEQLSVWIPATKGYIKYAFVRCEYDPYNANIWRIDKAYVCDNDRSVLFPITQGGEWEMAIMIADAPDYIGGNAHGDEVFTTFHVLIDGVEVSDITDIKDQLCENINIVETSLLYNPIDGATLSTREQFTPVGTHGREYIITGDGIRLKQFVKLDTALTLNASYMTMFPILRGNDTSSVLQVTDHYYADNNYIVYDVSVGGSGEGYGWKSHVTKANIWGVDSGVSASVEMLKQPDIVNAGARAFQVQDTVNVYNKMYWSICGVNNNPYSASANERFVTDSLYKIDVTK